MSLKINLLIRNPSVLNSVICVGSRLCQMCALGGFNDKEHRYFWRVPYRVRIVFSGLIRVSLYNQDAILGFEGFLVFEIF